MQNERKTEDLSCTVLYAGNDPRVTINRITQYIDEHIDEDISLTELADREHFNPSYLSRLFRQMTGETFTAYIFHRRMEKAMRDLIQTDKPVCDISMEAGYNSPQYFANVFKKTTGVTPLTYRMATKKVI